MPLRNGRRRVVIENLRPVVDDGRFPAKRALGENVVFSADIFTDGHDTIQARLLVRPMSDGAWTSLALHARPNDAWEAEFALHLLGAYEFTVEAWIDHLGTTAFGMRKKLAAGQDIGVDLLSCAGHLRQTAQRASAQERVLLLQFAERLETGLSPDKALRLLDDAVLLEAVHRYPDPELITRHDRTLVLHVERERALFSTWYELFPRSCSPTPGRHGTLRDVADMVPDIASMGFDVLYLPPIHPIGQTSRKGRDNAPEAGPNDPGSPWAIGAAEGGHTALHPDLGGWDDFDALVRKARTHGMEIALDLAFQCSPDHPYVRDHPDWFLWRPDGTVQYAENPPKKYQDVLPFNFESSDWEALWQELADVVRFWINKGVTVFRVDNPHTKPFAFWEWLITAMRGEHPDVLFLAEAFTRPKIMARLAKLGFSQSYSYFTWRNTKFELMDYMHDLTRSPLRDYFRPNFWPNTPDILPEFLQYGGRPAFVIRLVLAATLSSNYGIYGPAFELCATQAVSGKEEYLDSEKYEVRRWERDQPGNLRDLITRINRIRRAHPSLQRTDNLHFVPTSNDSLLAFFKSTPSGQDTLLVVVTLDPFQSQTGELALPLEVLGLEEGRPFLLADELSGERFIWHGRRPMLELNPHTQPARILSLKRTLKREHDFDYFL